MCTEAIMYKSYINEQLKAIQIIALQIKCILAVPAHLGEDHQ